MKYTTIRILFCLLIGINAYSQTQVGGAACAQMAPICTSNGLSFTAQTGVTAASVTNPGNNYGCLSTSPNPTWYYLQISQSGNIEMQLTANSDVDFALWGPFSNLAAAQSMCNSLSSPLSSWGGSLCWLGLCDWDGCSYSTSATEYPGIQNAVVGQVYIMLITNYASVVQPITLAQVGGTGATDCTIVVPSCSISSVTASPSNCNGSNQYNVSGQVTFANAPSTGTLTVSSSCGGSQVFNAPFTSPQSYSLNNLTANGASCTVTATFSANASCTGTASYTSPAIPTVGAGTDQSVCTGASATLNGSGASTYSWNNGVTNGVAFNPASTQTYTVTGTNAAGCTNTDQVVVTVNSNPTVDAGSYAAVCANVPTVALAGTPAGGTFSGTGVAGSTFTTSSGTQTITYNYTDGNGCSGSDVATITVNPMPIVDAGNNQTFCSGATTQLQGSGTGSVSWSPTTGLSDPTILNPTAVISATQSYTLTVTNNGCTSIDLVTITITNPPTLTITPDQSICAGDCSNLSVSGADFYVWEPSADITDPSLANQTVCPAATATYTVHGYAIGGSAMNNGDFSLGNIGFTSDYTLNTSLQNESTYFVDVNASLHHPGFANVVDHTTGSGNFMIVNGAGTPNSSVWCQTVDVQANQDYVFSTWVTSVAAGSPAILQFSINGSPLGSTFTAPTVVGQWDEFYQTWNSGGNTSATICIVNQNTTLGGNDFGLDDIFFSAICEATETVTVTVNQYPNATINAQTALCLDAGTVTLSAAQGGGTWSGPGVNASTGVFDPATAGVGTHSIIYTINGPCPDDDTIQVVVNALPTANAGGDQAICVGNQVTLAGSGASTLSWSGGIVDNTPFTPANTQTYTLTVTDANGCEDSDDVVVQVNSLPNVVAGGDQAICAGTSVTLSGSGAVTYTWDNGVNNGVSFTPSVGTVVYTVSGTDANGCVNTDQVTVVVLAYPTADITTLDDTVGYAPLLVNFDNNSQNASNYSWDFGNGQSLFATSTSSQTASYNAIGSYYVVLTASNTICQDSDTMTVIVIPYPDPYIHVPNVFTPNGDNANDIFFFDTQYISELHVQIFNRWGDQMYAYDTVTGGWDGKVKNKEAEDGTYFFTYTAKGMNGEELNGHGHVTLAR